MWRICRGVRWRGGRGGKEGCWQMEKEGNGGNEGSKIDVFLRRMDIGGLNEGRGIEESQYQIF